MPTTRKAVAVRKSASAPIPGLVQTSLLVPEALHKSMKTSGRYAARSSWGCQPLPALP